MSQSADEVRKSTRVRWASMGLLQWQDIRLNGKFVKQVKPGNTGHDAKQVWNLKLKK